MAPAIPGCSSSMGCSYTGGSLSGCGHLNARASADLLSLTDCLFIIDGQSPLAEARRLSSGSSLPALEPMSRFRLRAHPPTSRKLD